MNDVIAALPRDELKALVEKKLETRQHLKTLVKALKSLVVEVSIHFFYFNFVICCLCYMHNSV